VIDGIGQIGIQVTELVVGQCRQVSDSIDSLKVTGIDIANILDDLLISDRSRTVGTTFEKTGIQANDLVSCLLHLRRQYAADISQMTCYEYSHGTPPVSLTGNHTHKTMNKA